MDSVERVVSWLEPIFPQLTIAVIRRSVLHPSNQVEPPNEQTLLQLCIDDLLVLRTFTQQSTEITEGEEDIVLAGFTDDSVDMPLTAINSEMKKRGDSYSQPIELDDTLDAATSPAAGDNVANIDSPVVIGVKSPVNPDEQFQDCLDAVRAEFPDVDPAYAEHHLRLKTRLKKPDPVQNTIEFLRDRKGLYVKTKTPYVPKDKNANSITKQTKQQHHSTVVIDTDLETATPTGSTSSGTSTNSKATASLSKPSTSSANSHASAGKNIARRDSNTASHGGGGDGGDAMGGKASASLSKPSSASAASVLASGAGGDSSVRQKNTHHSTTKLATDSVESKAEKQTSGKLEKNLFPSTSTSSPGSAHAKASESASKDESETKASESESVQKIQPRPDPPKTKSTLQLQTDEVCSMFPDVDPIYVTKTLIHGFSLKVDEPLAWMVNQLLENSTTYPKKPKPTASQTASQATTQDSGASATDKQEVKCPDYFTDFSSEVSETYRYQCRTLLEREFRRVPVRDIRLVMTKFNCHYAATHRALEQGLEDAGFTTNVKLDTPNSLGDNSNFNKPQDKQVTVTFQTGASETIKSFLLKQGRQKRHTNHSIVLELQQEIEFLINQKNIRKEDKDRLIAISLNENEYEATGQSIECGCCYGDFPFESMIQCYEGHLFCKGCLGNYAKEAVFGEGKAKLSCMSNGCDATFPKSQLELSLPSNVLAKYEDRCQEEAINLADMEDLVRCPACDFAAIMDPGDKVFKCQNAQCLKETCRYCKEEWAEHFGKPCSEVEKTDETKLRLSYEEKMTMAKIRQCHKCKASFTKSDGCNKMTCRCGAKMCYICREPVKDYKHFCNHPKDPGFACATCTACSLWTNPDEDDDRAVKEIKEEAQRVRKEQGYEGERSIGAPEEPKPKKQKTEHHNHAPQPAAAAAAARAARHQPAGHHHQAARPRQVPRHQQLPRRPPEPPARQPPRPPFVQPPPMLHGPPQPFPLEVPGYYQPPPNPQMQYPMQVPQFHQNQPPPQVEFGLVHRNWHPQY